MSTNLVFSHLRLAALCYLLLVGPSLQAQSDTTQDNIFTTKVIHTGIFKTWDEFRLNNPSITENFKAEPVSKFDRYVTAGNLGNNDAVPNQLAPNTLIHMGVILKDSKGHKIHDAFAVYDGEALYINSGMYQSLSNVYWRVLDAGPIMYFRDPRMNSLNALATGAIAGPPGIVLGEAVSSHQPDGVMVFSKDDGDTYEVDEGSLESVFEEYDKELLKQFLKEADRQDAAVLQKYVILYNRRHIDD
ncbi:MAG TPA: hypothetical protein VG737_08820 [Cyclobacteriaceae bacterium]|nr:hypothetical protein [Cyclobacteriaceae bacterium]